MLYLTLCRKTIWKPGINWMNFITTYCQSNMSFQAIPLESPSAKSDVFRSELDNDLAVPLVSTAKNQHKIVAILQFHTVFTTLTSHIIFLTVKALKQSNRKRNDHYSKPTTYSYITQTVAVNIPKWTIFVGSFRISVPKVFVLFSQRFE